jgi:uncharacterized protein
MPNKKVTLVIGASENTERYSNKAIRQLLKNEHPVIAISNKAGVVADVVFNTELENFRDIHTVTLYVGPKVQPKYYKYIVSLKPKRVIFNPGTENEAFYKLLDKNDIAYQASCTLVMLSIGIY